MSTETEVKRVLVDWAVTRSDEVVKNPKDGYYSFEIVHDAYLKGIQKAQDTFLEDFRGVYFKKLVKVGDYLSELFKFMDTLSVKPVSFFINHGFDVTKAIISIAPEKVYNIDFIQQSYPKLIELQDKARVNDNILLNISFIENSENLNQDLLESDGFDLQHTF